MRDEIKKYIGKPELKDKKNDLLDVRKFIEVVGRRTHPLQNAMEKYKVWERDMKRK